MSEFKDWPKWVPVHESHIEKHYLGHRIVHGFSDFHDDRVTKEMTVLVTTPEEMARATKKKDTV